MAIMPNDIAIKPQIKPAVARVFCSGFFLLIEPKITATIPQRPIQPVTVTTSELAAITKINSGTLSSYLKTKGSMPPADKALKIARALDVSIDFLVEGFDVKAEKDKQKKVQIPIEVYKLACDLSSLSKEELDAIKCVMKVFRKETESGEQL